MGEAKQLVCGRCTQAFSPLELRNLCSCGGPLLVEYDLDAIRSSWGRERISPIASMWRYEPVLPASLEEAVTLGEGWTPLLRTPSLGENVWVKDEGTNPTGSFKARGMSAAVTMARKLGAEKLAAPSAGNAGGALAAYAARAGLEAHVFMPSDVPQANFVECMANGASVTLVNGLISDCGRLVSEQKEKNGWFEVSTLKEPYRIEGKKTMGYEIAEQFEWQLPDAILYPCGGGVGLIGMWKAFGEMERLGWIGSKRPKMIAVQAAGCAPIVRAFESGAETSEPWANAHTVASGLRVPKALGDFLVLRAIRASGGTAIAADDQEALDGSLAFARAEGIFGAPETGACIAALAHLFDSGFLERNAKIVVFNTGSGLKYLEAFATRFSRRAASEQDKLGGLITPR
ncbi:MAG TPA: threonine synthase [Bryobacteraceae bacterium]|jgi:threonine synthase|nr:threonine synthase [Bryobacteraceae bacterium]